MSSGGYGMKQAEMSFQQSNMFGATTSSSTSCPTGHVFPPFPGLQLAPAGPFESNRDGAHSQVTSQQGVAAFVPQNHPGVCHQTHQSSFQADPSFVPKLPAFSPWLSPFSAKFHAHNGSTMTSPSSSSTCVFGNGESCPRFPLGLRPSPSSVAVSQSTSMWSSKFDTRAPSPTPPASTCHCGIGSSQPPSICQLGIGPKPDAAAAAPLGFGVGQPSSAPAFEMASARPAAESLPIIMQHNGSTIRPAYSPTTDPETGFSIISISANQGKSHEELRCEHYTAATCGLQQQQQPASALGAGALLPAGAFYLVPASQFVAGSPLLLNPNQVVPLLIRNVYMAPTTSAPYQLENAKPGDLPRHKSQLEQMPMPCRPSDPFGRLPDMHQLSFKHHAARSSSPEPRSGGTPPCTRPSSSLLTSRPMCQWSRSRLQARKLYPKKDAAEACSLWDTNEIEMLVSPRGNPRALFLTQPNTATACPQDAKDDVCVNNAQASSSPESKSDEASLCTASQLPKVTSPDYYVQPSVAELMVAGCCDKVDNFVVGRRGHGEIRFIGRTDVRGLDVCDIIQFNKHEVFVYMDESRKPPIGQGLNKPAEVTLFSIRCIDKGTGRPFYQGPEAERFEMMLREQAEKQGSHFISYDALTGEWKFLVDHFSTFGLRCHLES